jgi:hypothetical protein
MEEQFEMFDSESVAKWKVFHRENPAVYDLFKRFTFEVIRAGFDHYSTEAIINQIRWHTSVVTTDWDFKINNDYKPFYSRLFMLDHPEYDEFFRLRRSKADGAVQA